MRGVKVKSVQLSCHIHSTENTERVVSSIMRLIPARSVQKVERKVETLHGHFGNRITAFTVKSRDSSVALEMLRSIASSLTEDSKRLLATNLHLHLDPTGNLIFRLDKQKLVLGRGELSYGSDVVKVVVSFKLPPKQKAGLKEVLKELGLIA